MALLAGAGGGFVAWCLLGTLVIDLFYHLRAVASGERTVWRDKDLSAQVSFLGFGAFVFGGALLGVWWRKTRLVGSAEPISAVAEADPLPNRVGPQSATEEQAPQTAPYTSPEAPEVSPASTSIG
jgi:hypothetical protein